MKIQTEEPELKVAIPVPERIVERLKGQGVEIRETNSGKHFAYFVPTKWCPVDNTCTIVKTEIKIPYSLINERIFINMNECIRLNKEGRLQELQTVCRDTGEEFAPLYLFKGNDQDRPRSIVFDIVSVDYRERIIILKSELVNEQYIHSIIGLKAERVEDNQVMLTAQWLYEAHIKEGRTGHLETAIEAVNPIEVWYRKAIKSHLSYLKSNLRLFRSRINNSGSKVLKMGIIA